MRTIRTMRTKSFTFHSTFNYVYLPFNDMSICQAIMVAFHLCMFHYHMMSVVHLILIVKGLNPGVISYR